MTRGLLVFVVALAGCGEVSATRLRVVVESGYAAPTEIDRIEIEVDSTGLGGGAQRAEVDLSAGSMNMLPARLGLSHPGGDAPLGPFTVIARGLLGDALIDEARREDVAFVRDEEREVVLVLGNMGDAGTRDGGALDGGPPGDGGLCAPPDMLCRGSCRNTEIDVDHCGGCDLSCNGVINVAEVICTGGDCAYAGGCLPDFTDCDRNEDTGCECDTRTHRCLVNDEDCVPR